MTKANKAYIIAEAGINHNGDLKLAKQMVGAVKQAGADCIKFQTFKAEEFITDPKLTYTYKSQGKEVTESMLKMFKRYQFTKEEWQEIINYCREQGVAFSSTAQNPTDLDFLLSLTDLPFIKVGSDDLTNLDLIDYYAKQGKPMIISAGMAFAGEIEDAVRTVRQAGCRDLTVLHCISSYPADAEEVNLKKIPVIRDAFGVKVGFSDHTVGSAAAVGAVCFGATMIEKHFTMSHDLPGPDHWFSIEAEAEELKQYVADIRFVEQALGLPQLKPTSKEMAYRDSCRRSIVVKVAIKAGEKLSDHNLEFKRPGTGISPRYKKLIIGRIAERDYRPGELI
jgi:N,N'-diacetyllegionaminate synthase